MSTKVMAHYWERDISGTKKLCLLALADYAGDDGIAYPGISRLAKRCSCSERNIQKTLRQLEDEGELRTEHNDGIRTVHGHTNRYYLVDYRIVCGVESPPKRVNPSSPGEPQFAPGVNPSSPQEVNPSSPDPSVEPSVDPSVDQSDWISRPEPCEAERLFEQIIGRTVVQFESEELRQLSQQHPASHFKAAFEVIAERIEAGQNIKYPVEYAKPILLQAISMGLAAFEQPAKSNHPAVAAFIEYWGKQPNDEQRRLISDRVDSLDKWKEAMADWKARNYRWDNVPGQLDFYSKGANQGAGKEGARAAGGKKVPTEGWHAGLIKPYKPKRQYSEAEIDEWLNSFDDQPPVPTVRPLRKRPGAAAAD